MSKTGKSYPSDVTDDEWEFVVSYLTLMAEDVPQRAYCMRSVFNALRYLVKTGCPWRYLPNDFPPWTVVYQQARRWVAAKLFESIAQDLRMVVRMNSDRAEDPTAVIIDA
jgi:transposase